MSHLFHGKADVAYLYQRTPHGSPPPKTKGHKTAFCRALSSDQLTRIKLLSFQIREASTQPGLKGGKQLAKSIHMQPSPELGSQHALAKSSDTPWIAVWTAASFSNHMWDGPLSPGRRHHGWTEPLSAGVRQRVRRNGPIGACYGWVRQISAVETSSSGLFDGASRRGTPLGTRHARQLSSSSPCTRHSTIETRAPKHDTLR